LLSGIAALLPDTAVHSLRRHTFTPTPVLLATAEVGSAVAVSDRCVIGVTVKLHAQEELAPGTILWEDSKAVSVGRRVLPVSRRSTLALARPCCGSCLCLSSSSGSGNIAPPPPLACTLSLLFAHPSSLAVGMFAHSALDFML
jgi:hypothetical protein